jgi:hypothetical protein
MQENWWRHFVSGGCRRTASFSLLLGEMLCRLKTLGCTKIVQTNATQLKLSKTLSQNLVELVGIELLVGSENTQVADSP